MSYDTLRVYEAGRFHDVDLPNWYRDAVRLCDTDRVDWHDALDRVLDCEYIALTEEGQVSASLEIRFWPSEVGGYFVLIETPLAFVEQVVVINPVDWLPFLSQHLAPIMATSIQSNLLSLHGKIGNAFIAWARHGEGDHVDRETGQSWIDLRRDRERRRLARTRTTEGGVA